MSLATRPRPSTHTRKRQANHHRRSKNYVKTYLPYLPMFAIIIGGVLLNKIWTSSGASAASLGSTTTRLSTVTGSHSSTVLYVVLAITFAAFFILLVTHWYRLQRLLNRGEAFMVHHPLFDVSL